MLPLNLRTAPEAVKPVTADFRPLRNPARIKEDSEMNNVKHIPAIDIIILVISIAIPQVLFFWLVPETLACRLVVYSFCTFVTIVNAMGSAAIWAVKGMRIAAAPCLLSYILTLVIVSIGIVLLIADVTVKTALFSLLTALLLYALIMLVFITTLEK